MLLNILNDLWTVLAVVCYAATTIFVFRDMDRSTGHISGSLASLLVVGAIAHGLNLASALFSGPTVDFSLGNALSLASWVVVVLFLIALARQPLATLALIVVPFALVSVLADRFWSGPPMQLAESDGSGVLHTLISVVAYGLLALAFCHAVVLLLQERHLQQRRPGGFFHSLPPLETMERILFQLIALGFFLLTIALVSGGIFSARLFGRAILFNHHVILSIVAWLAFGTLLAGRVLLGWRGRLASFWTVGSFLVLALAYFGSRFVLEVVLGRN